MGVCKRNRHNYSRIVILTALGPFYLVIVIAWIVQCAYSSDPVFNLQATFRSLVGNGYQTLQSLLLGYCVSGPSEGLLNALLDMLVDGTFDLKSNPIIKVTRSFT